MSDIKRLPATAGIAIGAILFVIAILAILIGAIAAGSGTFGTSGTSESYRTMGGALVQQGVTLSVGFQRILTNGVDESQIIITPQYSAVNEQRALFAPVGGGISPVFPMRDAIATGATWRYVIDANMLGFGSSGNNDVIAVVEIRNAAVCQAINSVVIGLNAPLAITLAVLPGVPVAADVTGTDGVIDVANSFDTSAVSSLSGIRQACVQDSSGTPRFWYYHLIKAN